MTSPAGRTETTCRVSRLDDSAPVSELGIYPFLGPDVDSRVVPLSTGGLTITSVSYIHYSGNLSSICLK